MKQLPFPTLLAGVALTIQVAFAADDIFINTGDMTFPYGEAPQIDATAFYNSGTIEVLTAPLPFDFTSTLNFTNRGTMSGSVGFTFDFAGSSGKRLPAANFFNQRGGLIEAYEYFYAISSNTYYYPTLIAVEATNIVNEGTLSVANAGLVRLEGKNINLSRGAIDVATITPDFAAGWLDPQRTTYVPDAGIFDQLWGTGSEPTNNYPPQDSASIVRPFGGQLLAVSPVHFVANLNQAGYYQIGTLTTLATGMTNVNGGLGLTLTNADGTFTNIFLPTNIIRQVALIGLGDTNNFTARAKFYPSTVPDVTFNSIAVELRLLNTNVVAVNGETNTLYIIDRLASETNLILGTNMYVTPYPTLRPAAYEVGRTMPNEFYFGFNGNSVVDRNLVYEPGFSNRFVTNFYASHSAYVDYVATRPPLVPGLGPLDQPGRIEIVGDRVDLTKARFRGQGVVSVDAKHLVSSSNAVLDSPNLLFNLGATNGLLTVENLSKSAALRLEGLVEMWSGLWTNQMAMVLSNWYIDATTNYFSPYTNPVDVGIHVLILSADSLTATQRVVAHDFVLHSTNIIVNDPVIVSRKLILDGQALTLNGSMSLTNVSITNGLYNWYGTNMPGVRYFTNNGTLTVPNITYLGSDIARPLAALVNHGTINSFGQKFAADYYEDTGTVNTSNALEIVASSAKLDGGRNLVGGAVLLQAGDLKMRNHTIVADAGVFFSVTNSLSDAGGGSDNTITVEDGFHLLVKPTAGDLLGTTFESTAGKFASVLHTWVGEDRGPVAEGFKDNAAIGRLVLRSFKGSEFSELRFSGPIDFLGNPLPGEHALYVDYLELQTAVQGDPTSQVETLLYIYPGFRIYFANANILPERLDGLYEGRLRWVKSYAGPSSGTQVASRQSGYEVKTITVNTALLNSQLIDSDGDGLANAYDNWPFDGVTLNGARFVETQPLKFEFWWEGAAETVYRVEYTTSLKPTSWTTLTTITNSAPTSQTLTVTDTLPAGQERERYYRVRYDL
jgi:hypothetical protein